jgi:hypothetical protein
MKLSVLSYGISINHGSIVPLASLDLPQSITDFNGFIFDPRVFSGTAISGPTFFRRQAELQQLVHLKGGIVICVLRPDFTISVSGAQHMSIYTLLGNISPVVELVRSTVVAGEGSQFTVISAAMGTLAGYFRVLQKNIRFAAHLSADTPSLERNLGTVFAVNSPGFPIAVEFRVGGGGRLCFVPPPQDVTGERVGAAFAQILDAQFSDVSDIEAPSWATDVTVPGADAFDPKIAELETTKDQIIHEISELDNKREALVNYRRLLYSSGRPLEQIVRAALRLLGFDVPEPDTYEGEWDVQLRDPRSGATALGEVEGPDGAVDVNKSRQLLDCIEGEALLNRRHKGILIGNGYRMKPPDSEERQAQFTNHALVRASMYGTCLLPTTELFKAVCAVLKSPDNEGLKIEVRNSILNTVGPWTFSGQVMQPHLPQQN